ncbi:MAG: FG-GAP repeat protein, partial [Verrucomicrobia bacterium]|nr:FG-GAP repeat protein [Verrucomicrobiota bacterium]
MKTAPSESSAMKTSRLFCLLALTLQLASPRIQTPLSAAAPVPAQQAYLKASNTGAGDNFGYIVALSGDTLVVGVPNEDSNATGANGNQSDNTATNSGAAYVFVRNGANW